MNQVHAGQLADEPLAGVLARLGQEQATGTVLVRVGAQPVGRVSVRDGMVVGASGERPRSLLTRLVVGAALSPEAAELFERGGPGALADPARRLVETGSADAAAVGAAVVEGVYEALDELCARTSGSWEFVAQEPSVRAAGAMVSDLLPGVTQRRKEWSALAGVLGSMHVAPQLAAPWIRGRTQGLVPEGWAVLCRVDGLRRVVDLADECGLTLLEVGRVLVDLLERELLVLPAVAPAAPPPAAPAAATSAERPAEPPQLTDMAALLRELSSLGLDDEPALPARPARVPAPDRKLRRRPLFTR